MSLLDFERVEWDPPSHPPPRISSFFSFLGPCLLLLLLPKSCWAIPVWQGEEDPLREMGLLMSNDCTGLLYGMRGRKEEGFFLLSCAMDFCLGPVRGAILACSKKNTCLAFAQNFAGLEKKGFRKPVFLSPMGRDTQHLFFGAHNLLLLLLHPRFPPF